MRILVTNSGGAGGVIGSQLMIAGYDVTFLDDRRRAAALDRERFAVKAHSGGDDYRGHSRHIEAAEIMTTYDLIIVAAKAHKLDDLATILHRAVGNGTVILPLVDGFDHLARLDEACQSATILDGQHDVVTLLNDRHEVAHLGTGTDQILIGPRRSSDVEIAEKAVALFVKTDLDVRIVADLERRRWERMVRLVGVGGLAALMGAEIERIGRFDNGHTHLWQIMAECSLIATASNQKLDVPALAEFMERLPRTTSVDVSRLLTEIQRGDLREASVLVQQMQRRARAANVPAPVIDLVTTALLSRRTDSDPDPDEIEAVDPPPAPAPRPSRDGWFSRRWSPRTGGARK